MAVKYSPESVLVSRWVDGWMAVKILSRISIGIEMGRWMDGCQDTLQNQYWYRDGSMDGWLSRYSPESVLVSRWVGGWMAVKILSRISIGIEMGRWMDGRQVLSRISIGIEMGRWMDGCQDTLQDQYWYRDGSMDGWLSRYSPESVLVSRWVDGWMAVKILSRISIGIEMGRWMDGCQVLSRISIGIEMGRWMDGCQVLSRISIGIEMGRWMDGCQDTLQDQYWYRDGSMDGRPSRYSPESVLVSRWVGGWMAVKILSRISIGIEMGRWMDGRQDTLQNQYWYRDGSMDGWLSRYSPESVLPLVSRWVDEWMAVKILSRISIAGGWMAVKWYRDGSMNGWLSRYSPESVLPLVSRWVDEWMAVKILSRISIAIGIEMGR